MNKHTEHPPAIVPLAQQAGATLARWSWVKPCAWTVRMLTALEVGVKGDKWFRLIDKVYAERNLTAAFQQVAEKDGAAGIDHVSVQEFEKQTPENLWALEDALKTGKYQPQSVKRVHIPKPGTNETRPLGIPTVRDRVVQAAIVNVIEPIFERDFAEQSYGFRPGRGCKDALRRVRQLINDGYHHVVDADLKSYFDTIPHNPLMERLKTRIADGPLLTLIESFLKASILDEMSEWNPVAGAPQGAVLSPLLSNIYLDPLDHLMAQAGIEMVRYADDFVILCRTPEAAEQALESVRQWVAENGLTLHPVKTRIVDVRNEGFDFLGYHFTATHHWPRKKSIKKLKDAVRKKTGRNSGKSLKCIIVGVNQTLRGWFEYFKHSCSTTFEPLDGWIRMRLRSILRKRAGRRGRGRGLDHHRWKNSYFAKQGLFSLRTAYAQVVQSSQR